MESNYGKNIFLKEKLFDSFTSGRWTPYAATTRTPSEIFIDKNVRATIDLRRPKLTPENNSSHHKTNLALRTFSPNKQAVIREYGGKAIAARKKKKESFRKK